MPEPPSPPKGRQKEKPKEKEKEPEPEIAQPSPQLSEAELKKFAEALIVICGHMDTFVLYEMFGLDTNPDYPDPNGMLIWTIGVDDATFIVESIRDRSTESEVTRQAVRQVNKWYDLVIIGLMFGSRVAGTVEQVRQHGVHPRFLRPAELSGGTGAPGVQQ